MSILCDIKLDDPNGNGVYYAGQVVAGCVTLKLKKKKRIKLISVTIEGFSHWIMLQPGTTNSTYEGREEFIDETSVVRCEPDYINCELPIGEYVYYFSFNLPPAIPPSFESKIGHIRYRVLVHIEQWNLSCSQHKVQFTVLIPLDLNAFDAQIRSPICVKRNYTKLFSSRPKLGLKVDLQRTGFAIGEQMRINVDANNLSHSMDINSFTFTIDQLISYRIYSRSGKQIIHRERVEIYKEKSGCAPRLSHTNFVHLMTIPYMPVTIFTSRDISVVYEVTVRPSGYSDVMLIPIVMANIPICDERATNYEPITDNGPLIWFD